MKSKMKCRVKNCSGYAKIVMEDKGYYVIRCSEGHSYSRKISRAEAR